MTASIQPAELREKPKAAEPEASPAEAEETPPGPQGEPEKARGPFALKPGARIVHGARRGTVEVVRGGGREPYDVRITWDGEKYPQWFLYTNLRQYWEKEELEVE